MPKIAITDYFTEDSVEREILGDLVGIGPSPDTEVLLVWHEHINEQYVSQFPKIKAVQRYGVGYDTLDIPFLLSQGIRCCNNPDYGTDEVADTAVAMIMNIARGISQYNHLSKGYFKDWQENINPVIKRNSETTIGVVGAGRIGGSVVLKCNALKFKTLFYDPFKERGHEKMLGTKRVDSLEELLALSDIVTLHAPLSAKTKGMVDEHFIENMKRGASIVNTARGGLVKNLDILLEGLLTGHLNQVALDVLIHEPPKAEPLIDAWRDNHPDITGRLIINPHTSYYSQESYLELRRNAAKNALRLLNDLEAYNILTA